MKVRILNEEIYIDGNAMFRVNREYPRKYGVTVHFLQYIKKLKLTSVFEAFAGFGIKSILYQKLLDPTFHVVSELDGHRFEKLQENLDRFKIAFFNEDSHKLIKDMDYKFDVIDLDIENADHYRTFIYSNCFQSKIFENAKAIILTDSFIYALSRGTKSVKNPIFSNILRGTTNKERIVEYLSQYKNFGKFHLKFAYFGHNSSQILLIRNEINDYSFEIDNWKKFKLPIEIVYD